MHTDRSSQRASATSGWYGAAASTDRPSERKDRTSYLETIPVARCGLVRPQVVGEMNGVVYKYICCDGACPGAPSTAPVPRAPGAAVEMLIDVTADPYDMHDLAPTLKDVAAKLRMLLPPAFAARCSSLAVR